MLKHKFTEFYNLKNQNLLLSFINKDVLSALVDKYKTDKYVKKLFTENIIKVYILSCLSKPKHISLRQIVRSSDNLIFKIFTKINSISRTGFSKCNKDINFSLFAELFNYIIQRLDKKSSGEIKKECDKIKIFDTTFIMLSLKLFRWANMFGTNNLGFIKIGIRIDDMDILPNKVVIETKDPSDNSIFEDFIDYSKQCITYIFDRGFNKIRVLDRINQSGNFFITRIYPSYKVEVVKSIKIRCRKNNSIKILKDEKIKIGSGKNKSKNIYRLITAQVDKKKYLFLTNRFDLFCYDVCELYKHRWQIETLFKWLKQYLKINKLISHSFNGVMIQIYMALILHMLLILYKEENKLNLSLLEVMSLIENKIIDEILESILILGLLGFKLHINIGFT